MIYTYLTAATIVSTLLTVIFLLLPTPYISPKARKSRFADDKKEPSAEYELVDVQILVLGDIGRSPRMQYHALSIAKRGGHVQLVGYQGNRVNRFHRWSLPNMSQNPNRILICYLILVLPSSLYTLPQPPGRPVTSFLFSSLAL